MTTTGPHHRSPLSPWHRRLACRLFGPLLVEEKPTEHERRRYCWFCGTVEVRGIETVGWVENGEVRIG